ncbi:MAG: hypothetical protein U0930_10980 [Pirellulales bacterium]
MPEQQPEETTSPDEFASIFQPPAVHDPSELKKQHVTVAERLTSLRSTNRHSVPLFLFLTLIGIGNEAALSLAGIQLSMWKFPWHLGLSVKLWFAILVLAGLTDFVSRLLDWKPELSLYIVGSVLIPAILLFCWRHFISPGSPTGYEFGIFILQAIVCFAAKPDWKLTTLVTMFGIIGSGFALFHWMAYASIT